jgi:hypothetical protein
LISASRKITSLGSRLPSRLAEICNGRIRRQFNGLVLSRTFAACWCLLKFFIIKQWFQLKFHFTKNKDKYLDTKNLTRDATTHYHNFVCCINTISNRQHYAICSIYMVDVKHSFGMSLTKTLLLQIDSRTKGTTIQSLTKNLCSKCQILLYCLGSE